MLPKISNDVTELLWENVRNYNRNSFIESDPISIPHRFLQKKDIEISAFSRQLWHGVSGKPSFQAPTS